MIKEHTKRFFLDFYQNYKYPCISYAVLILISLIFFTSHSLHTFGTFSFLSIVNATITEPIIYGPLLIGIAFFAINFIWNKKFLLKQRFIDIVAIVVFSFVSSMLINLIYGIANPMSTAYWSDVFMNADHALFGAFPAFWMFHHTSQVFAWLVITVYGLMPTFITAWILFLFLYKEGAYLNRFINMLYLTVAICLPLWLIFQALGPGQMYLANLLHTQPPQLVIESLKDGPPSKYVDDTVLYYVRFWQDPTGKTFAISTFPSMHTIWGFILFYSALEVFRKKKYGWIACLLLFLIACFNMLGAIFVLQHYAVDILSGIFLAVCISKIPFKKKEVQTI